MGVGGGLEPEAGRWRGGEDGGGAKGGREGEGGGEGRRDARRKDCPTQCIQCTPRLLSVIRPKLSFLASVGGIFARTLSSRGTREGREAGDDHRQHHRTPTASVSRECTCNIRPW